MRLDLALAAIIEAEKLEVSDEEVEAEFKKMADQYSMDLEMVKKYLQADQVKDQLLTQKAVAVVVDSATAIKPEKKTAKKTAKKAEKEAEEAETETETEAKSETEAE